MLSLIIAASLAAANPTHVAPAPGVTVPTQDELEATGQLCLGIFTGNIQLQEVLDKLHLTTRDQQQSLVTSCSIYVQGFSDGIQAAKSAPHQPEQPNQRTKDISLELK